MIKKQNWDGYEIRFVEKDGEWWAVLADICKALELTNPTVVAGRIDENERAKHRLGRQGEATIISELGVYQALFQSRKKEAKGFQTWVFKTIKQLREKIGLESHDALEMTSKKHQKECHDFIEHNIPNADKHHYCKANIIANKAVSLMHGLDKTIKKADMTPKMLEDRMPILDDTVQLMTLQEKFGVNISVSKTIYDKYAKENA